MSLINLIKRRKNIEYKESEGANLAIQTIDKFEDRKFTFKGLKRKFQGLSADDALKLIQDEMDNMVILYRYKTKVKTYIDKNGTLQSEIKLIGRAGKMNRYNPMDLDMVIKTE